MVLACSTDISIKRSDIKLVFLDPNDILGALIYIKNILTCCIDTQLL